MPNLASILKQEIARLARKEARAEIAALKRQSVRHRRDIADLKRQVDRQSREIAFLRKQEKGRLADGATPKQETTIRFSPAWLKAHREKLRLSADAYAKLVGVSMLSIYNWESGRTVPRDAQKAKLAAIRDLGKREALARLAMLDG